MACKTRFARDAKRVSLRTHNCPTTILICECVLPPLMEMCRAGRHCWPQLEEGLQEIRAALKPGKGRFFATTFLQGAYGNPVPETGGNAFRFFTEPELTELLVAAGFPPAGIEVRREGAGFVGCFQGDSVQGVLTAFPHWLGCLFTCPAGADPLSRNRFCSPS